MTLVVPVSAVIVIGSTDTCEILVSAFKKLKVNKLLQILTLHSECYLSFTRYE